MLILTLSTLRRQLQACMKPVRKHVFDCLAVHWSLQYAWFSTSYGIDYAVKEREFLNFLAANYSVRHKCNLWLPTLLGEDHAHKAATVGRIEAFLYYAHYMTISYPPSGPQLNQFGQQLCIASSILVGGSGCTI